MNEPAQGLDQARRFDKIMTSSLTTNRLTMSEVNCRSSFFTSP